MAAPSLDQRTRRFIVFLQLQQETANPNPTRGLLLEVLLEVAHQYGLLGDSDAQFGNIWLLVQAILLHRHAKQAALCKLQEWGAAFLRDAGSVMSCLQAGHFGGAIAALQDRLDDVDFGERALAQSLIELLATYCCDEEWRTAARKLAREFRDSPHAEWCKLLAGQHGLDKLPWQQRLVCNALYGGGRAFFASGTPLDALLEGRYEDFLLQCDVPLRAHLAALVAHLDASVNCEPALVEYVRLLCADHWQLALEYASFCSLHGYELIREILQTRSSGESHLCRKRIRQYCHRFAQPELPRETEGVLGELYECVQRGQPIPFRKVVSQPHLIPMLHINRAVLNAEPKLGVLLDLQQILRDLRDDEPSLLGQRLVPFLDMCIEKALFDVCDALTPFIPDALIKSDRALWLKLLELQEAK